MSIDTQNPEEPKFLNVVQVLAIDFCVTAAVFCAALQGGLSLGTSLLVAWLGGAALTVALIASVFHIRMRAMTAETTVGHAGLGAFDSPNLGGSDARDPLKVWKSDLEMEIKQSVTRMRASDHDMGRHDAVDRAHMVSEWEEDGAQDSEETRAVRARLRG